MIATHDQDHGERDVSETEGLVSTAGAAELKEYVPAADALAVGRLKASGAIILFGKSNTRPCRNRRELRRPLARSIQDRRTALSVVACLVPEDAAAWHLQFDPGPEIGIVRGGAGRAASADGRVYSVDNLRPVSNRLVVEVTVNHREPGRKARISPRGGSAHARNTRLQPSARTRRAPGRPAARARNYY
ncbi:MAG: hypothetical protein ACLQFR_04490 [Streptosporangiaceae bacterium]